MRADDVKKNELKPWLRKQWVIPPQANAEFVCAMEDVLEVYTRPYDPSPTGWCVWTNSASSGWRRPACPCRPNRVSPNGWDYEYERCGTGQLFLTGEPLAGRRHVTVTKTAHPPSISPTRCATCWRSAIRTPRGGPGDGQSEHAQNPPPCTRPSSRPWPARCSNGWRFTTPPKHGSGLNMAEIELSVLSRQCLDRRIPTPKP